MAQKGQSKLDPMIWAEIADRLEQAFEAVRSANDWTWPRLAKEMKTSKPTLANWISGHHFPTRKHWKRIEEVTEIKVEEFILGEGRAAKVYQFRDSVCQDLAEVEVLRSFRQCNAAGKEYLIKQARFALHEYPPDGHVVPFQPPQKIGKP